MTRRRLLICLIVLLACGPACAEEPDHIVLKNKHIRAKFQIVDGVWVHRSLSRVDGSDALTVTSDEFEILLFDDTRLTVKDYEETMWEHAPRGNWLAVSYGPKRGTSPKAPGVVMVSYSLGDGPVLHKTVSLSMREGEKIDRLQVLRFSTPQTASRGGRGEPVFVGNWFVGADYPCFYSRHSDGYVEPDYFYRHDYTIDLAGRDKEFAPRKGLVTVFHFPGHARKQPYGIWGIKGKRAVMGISKTPGESAELGLLDYIARTRKPPRSHLHYNNWYSPEGKDLSPDHLLPTVHKPIDEHLKKHGAKLDSIVPDHGWQNSKSFEWIFQPKAVDGQVVLPALSKALMDAGRTRLGAWMALDGTNQSISHGVKIGYEPAYAEGFKPTHSWMEGKPYFNILDPKYQRDLKKALRFLLVDAKVDYIKHDFNHNFTSDYLSQRHAREACLDVTLDLLTYERDLNPDVYQNYTNGTWFSPWWLQHVDALWMMSGDSGNSREWPLLSQRDRSTSYRDRYFFESFNNPERCARPIIPIANFMTHGIIFSAKKPFTDGRDLPADWANHVMMYYARGTMVKELYLTPKLLSEDQWDVLGKASAWAQRNQQRLVNTVIVGGNAAKGEVYGYVSWVDGRAILTVRNPARNAQTLTVPFDATVYYRGYKGRAYRARAIYPFVEPMPWALTSGTPFQVPVPGDTVIVYEIELGEPLSDKAVAPAPPPPVKAAVADGGFTATLTVPDEAMQRHELVVQAWSMVDVDLAVDGKTVTPRQSGKDARWSIHAFDLAGYRGKTITVTGKLRADPESTRKPGAAVPTEVWLIADRPVKASPAPTDQHLPPAISQTHRRQTQSVIPKQNFPVRER